MDSHCHHNNKLSYQKKPLFLTNTLFIWIIEHCTKQLKVSPPVWTIADRSGNAVRKLSLSCYPVQSSHFYSSLYPRRISQCPHETNHYLQIVHNWEMPENIALNSTYYSTRLLKQAYEVIIDYITWKFIYKTHKTRVERNLKAFQRMKIISPRL